VKVAVFALFIFTLVSCSQKRAGMPGAEISSVNSVIKKSIASLKKGEIGAMPTMMHFPFYTCRFQNDDGYTLPCDPVTMAEFKEYATLIYNDDVLRLLPLCRDEDIIDVTGKNELYYKELQKATDINSKLYEFYIQYPETSTQAESYFGFVFGRVKGKYRVIAYYSKWAVKG
jgi:hypothetical protein